MKDIQRLTAFVRRVDFVIRVRGDEVHVPRTEHPLFFSNDEFRSSLQHHPDLLMRMTMLQHNGIRLDSCLAQQIETAR